MLVSRPDIDVQSNVTGHSIKMSIDASATQHIVSLLTDMYSDPELAVIREYGTNALDSHVAAGQTRPIEITTPTALHPFFTIKDYGLGMNEQDIEETYSRYGVSTKRESNEMVGVLGIGCKSALTYTSQFTLVGIKNGVRTTVAVSRDEDGVGSMTVVESGPDASGNGVTIVIPVKNRNEFEIKSRNFFKYWAPGTVLVNGEAPETLEGLKITDKLIATKSTGWSDRQHVIVMGGVPYPIDSAEIALQMSQNFNLTAFVNIGEIDFAPSRELLMYTRRTKDTIEKIQREVTAALVTAAQKAIDAASGPAEALRISREWQGMIPNFHGNFRYRQQDIPETVDAPAGESIIATQNNAYKLSSHSKYPQLSTSAFIDGLVVYGYDHTSFTPTHKRKLQQYSSDNGIKVENYILTNAKIDLTWADPSRVVPWADIKAIKLPVQQSAYRYNSRPLGSYKAYEPGEAYTSDVQAGDIDTSKPVYWVNKDLQSGVEALRSVKPDATLVLLPSNRVAKFCRDFPSAIKVSEAVQDLYDACAVLLTDQDIKSFILKAHHAHEMRDLMRMDITKIDDPAVSEVVNLMNHKIDAKILNTLDTLYRVATDRGVVQYNDWTNPMEKYPLLRVQYGTIHEHNYLYMNAAYAAESAGN